MLSLLLILCALCMFGWVESTGHDPLTHIYESYNGTHGFHHWLEFGAFYHHHINKLRSLDKVNMLEIGVQSGGSSRIWDRYFHKNELTYLGVDINPPCKAFEELPRIRIEIGSQNDAPFLAELCKKYGPFNFIVDDGGHTTEMIINTFKTLWSPSCVVDGGVYVVEDTHTMSLWKGRGGMAVDGQDIFHFFADLQFQQIDYFRSKIRKGPLISGGGFSEQPSALAQHIQSFSVADSILALHFRAQWKPVTEFKKGTNFIGYGVGAAGA